MIIRELVTILGFQFDVATFNKYDAAMASVYDKTDKLNQNLRRFADGIGNIGKSLTWKLTLPIVGLGTASVMAASELQSMSVAMTTIVGDAGKANKLMEEMFAFAKKTPFDIQGVQTATNMLLGMGFTAENVIENLSMLADVSAGTKSDFGLMARNFGQVRNLGRLMTKDMMQFQMAGIDITSEIAKVLGLRDSKVVGEMVTRGEIGFETVQKAFKNMTSEGGKFYKLSEKIALTTGGRFRNLGDAIFRFRGAFGKILVDGLHLDALFTKLADAFEKLASGLQKLPSWARVLLVVLLAIAAAVGPILIGLSGVIKTILMLQAVSLLAGKTIIGVLTGISLAALKVTVVVLAVAAALAAIFLIGEDIYSYFHGRESYFGDMVHGLEKAGAWIHQQVVKITDFFKDKIAEIVGLAKRAWTDFMSDMRAIGDLFKQWFNDLVGWAKGIIDKVPFLRALFGGGVQAQITNYPAVTAGNIFSGLTPAVAASTFVPNLAGITGNGMNVDVKSNFVFQVPNGTTEQNMAMWNAAAEKHTNELSAKIVEDIDNVLRKK
jgi:hypothetical protein